jgi:ribosomal protein S18 acetylase RimI-like enzyme
MAVNSGTQISVGDCAMLTTSHPVPIGTLCGETSRNNWWDNAPFAMLTIRTATACDREAIWTILEPVIRAGETYTLPRDLGRDAALAYWFADSHDVFVAEDAGQIVGTYFIQPNQRGGGSHVANCGYMTAPHAAGQGVASAMCAHSLECAAHRGFRAMQFNFVVSTNERAVHLWRRFGFEIVGRLPEAFRHPTAGYVDALVMYRRL